MDQKYPLSAADICFAGAALDFVLSNFEYLKGVPDEKVAQMTETRDRFERYNSDSYVP